MSRRRERASLLITNDEMAGGPEEACELRFGYDNLEGTVGVLQAAGSARIKELEVVFEVIFIEIKLKAHGSCNV